MYLASYCTCMYVHGYKWFSGVGWGVNLSSSFIVSRVCSSTLLFLADKYKERVLGRGVGVAGVFIYLLFQNKQTRQRYEVSTWQGDMVILFVNF